MEEKRIGQIFAPNPGDAKVLEELKKMKVVTPYSIASKFNLRISVAKDFLENLKRKGVLQLVAGSRYTRIYKVVV